MKALANAARHADEKNLALIKHTWPGYWEMYEKVGIETEKKSLHAVQ